MTDIDIDTYPVADLLDRYSLSSKQSLYNRLKALGIKPQKQGNKSFITAAQLETLDALHSHLIAGKALSEFPLDGSKEDSNPDPVSTLVPVTGSLDEGATSTGLLDEGGDLIGLIEAIAKALRPADPLGEYEALEKAVSNGWILGTGKVKELTGSRPTGDEWEWGSFTFHRAGKLGNQLAWRVERSGKGGG
ncbi:MAG: hypothetical protein ACM37W_00520 [Actinomycetota bacterium]